MAESGSGFTGGLPPMRLLILCLLTAVFLPGQESSAPSGWQEWHRRGVEAYRTGRYQEAAEAFQKALDSNSDDLAARTLLAKTWQAQYVPGVDSAKNQEIAKQAEAELSQVLSADSENKAAMLSLADLSYQEAQAAKDPDLKLKKAEQARYWYERIADVDPHEKKAYCSLGVLAWSKWYPNWLSARQQLGMKLSDPGPIADAAVRRQLRTQYGTTIENGIADLEKALNIDPGYGEALTYMNLFVWTRADLCDTKDEYLRDVQLAEQWGMKANEQEKKEAGGQTVIVLSKDALENGALLMPNQQSIRIPRLDLVRKVDPVYPPAARQAGIMGTVRFRVFILKDGRVENPQLISGDPLLVASARRAVEQWVYQPVVLNGAPVDVAAEVQVQFSISAQ
jgi:TonB family protein